MADGCRAPASCAESGARSPARASTGTAPLTRFANTPALGAGRAPSARLDPATVIALQRGAGNRAVARMLAGRPRLVAVSSGTLARCPGCGGTCGGAEADREHAAVDDGVTLADALVALGPGAAGTHTRITRAQLVRPLSRSAVTTLSQTTLQRSAVAIAGGVTLAALACAYPFYSYALDHYPAKGDKWMHCWVSCKIATYCGGPEIGSALATGIGAVKEAADWVCDQFGGACKAEWADFVADLEGIWCATGHMFSTCYSCCDEST